ncbi:MAG TPA: PHP domain-containing protein [Phycisphaerae bacterium]|nr:PHP domain-containing protein [Phycisphaerae bacterium]
MSFDYSKIVDCHCHTELAYCNSGVTAMQAVEDSKKAGLGGVCLTEHAPQLYCTADEFWGVEHINRCIWRNNPASRVPIFKTLVAPYRDDPFVRVGFEVELDADGCLTINDEDRQWADIVVGAIHWLAGEPRDFTQTQFIDAFVDTNRKILAGGVDVLAHPFRVFPSRKRAVDKTLYPLMADMLGEFNTAAEINTHHTSSPDPDFYALCIDRNVKISLGTDSHFPHQVGKIRQNLEVLQKAAGKDDVSEYLYYPGAKK